MSYEPQVLRASIHHESQTDRAASRTRRWPGTFRPTPDGIAVPLSVSSMAGATSLAVAGSQNRVLFPSLLVETICCAIRMPVDAVDLVTVAGEGADDVAGLRVPDNRRPVVARRGKAIAAGTVSDRIDLIAMFVERCDLGRSIRSPQDDLATDSRPSRTAVRRDSRPPRCRRRRRPGDWQVARRFRDSKARTYRLRRSTRAAWRRGCWRY